MSYSEFNNYSLSCVAHLRMLELFVDRQALIQLPVSAVHEDGNFT